MSTRIQYSTTTAMGQMVAEYVTSMIEAREKGTRLKLALDSMAYGTPPTFDRIETEITGMVPGEGEALYNLITAAVAAIDVDDVTYLTRLDQG
jgi:hypothetical protein